MTLWISATIKCDTFLIDINDKRGFFSCVLNSHGFSDSRAFRKCVMILFSYVFFKRYDSNPEEVHYVYLPITNNKRDWICKNIPEVKEHSSSVFQCRSVLLCLCASRYSVFRVFNCWSLFLIPEWELKGRGMAFLPNVYNLEKLVPRILMFTYRTKMN